ncbi:MAG: hypothetical protein WC496_01100 [Phycisphaerae bacterium]|jgi:hypothetical protein
MNAYRITDWDKNYEVTKDGKPATQRSKNIRKTSLCYVRLTVQGHNPSMSYREMLQKAAGKGMMVFGVFCKLLELAANQPRNYRGWLLDTKGVPLTAERIAFALCCDAGDIDFALQVLTDKDIGWILEKDFHTEQTKSDSDDKKDCPVIITKHNETEENITEQNETKQQSRDRERAVTEKTDADKLLEKVSRQISGRAIPQIGNLDSSFKNILKPTSSDSSVFAKASTDLASADSHNDEYRRLFRKWITGINDIFPQSKFGKSNRTTFDNMFNWLRDNNRSFDEKLLDKALSLAKEVRAKPGIDNPLAYFISRFKKDFGDFTKILP